MAGVEAIIGYRFKDRSLLIEALHVTGRRSRNSYVGSKRLALLGDAVLKLALVEPWYQEGTTTGILTLRKYQS